VGDEPVLINEVAANFESCDAYKKKIEFHVGPSGFNLATSANCRIYSNGRSSSVKRTSSRLIKVGSRTSHNRPGRPQSIRLLLSEQIEAALGQSNGKVSGAHGAAARLGMPPSTLESRIRSLKINKFQFKGV
jgi:transcriptional regulator with GAF, ATPase, and Fis domain